MTQDSRAVGWFAAVIIFAAIGCGGSDDKKIEKPAPDEELAVEPVDDMVAPEILDSIQRTFARKQTVIARCFVAGVEAGEIDKTAKGFVTVGAIVTPSGNAKRAEVLKASLASKALHRCITEMVESWTFDEPPRDVETSFTYTLERL